MRSSTKWIESRPDEAAHKVARRALGRHLARLSHYLQLSVADSPAETENVHQLRVFTRRAAAAMELFAAWLPKRRGKWLEKQLRKVRKAAGEARDFDVLLLRWVDHMRHAPSSHAALLVEQVKLRRREAQAPIEKIQKKFTRKHFARRAKRLLDRVRPRGATNQCDNRFGCVARAELRRVVVPYLEAAAGHLEDAAAMHAFRIQSKQLRYAMEIFADVFDEDFRRELYPLVESLQDRLGAINDHVTAQTYFAAWHSETDSMAVRAALEMGIDREQQDLQASRREFLDWWSPSRRENLARRFARYVEFESTGNGPAADSEICPR
jgi:CHAD domain-containing protein